VEFFSCSVKYRFASSHLRRCPSSPSRGIPYAEWLDCRLDPDGRPAEEERLCPAFWIVFWRVMSLSESSRSSKVGRLERTGDMGGGEVVVMGAWLGGERW
jgi:hypothetical protein